MPDTGVHEVSFGDIFGQLEDDERISVRAGDLKVFLAKALTGVGTTEPTLSFSYRGIEQEAALSFEHDIENAATCVGKHLANGVDDEVICDITWWREDVVTACKHVYGIKLDRDDEAVESMIDGVVDRIGDNLQERSTEFGYELIYDELPGRELVDRLVAQEADKLIRERYDDAYEIIYDDSVGGDEQAFYIAAPSSESDRGTAEQPTAVFIEYAKDFTGSAYDLCNAAISVTCEVDALIEERETEEQAKSVADNMLGRSSGYGSAQRSPSEISAAAKDAAARADETISDNTSIRR